MEIKGTTLIIPQGDTETVRFRKRDPSTGELTPWDVADYEFTVINRLSRQVVFTAQLAVTASDILGLAFPMSSADTNLPEGEYLYGLRQKIAPDFVHTEILEGRINIVRGVKNGQS